MPPRDHSEHSTSSPGKLLSEAFIVNALNPSRQRRGGCIIGVMGCPDNGSAERHVKHWNAWGYDQEQQIIIDVVENVKNKITNWAAVFEYRGAVLSGLFEDIIPLLVSYGITITSIDADVCGPWGTFEETMINTVIRLSIPQIAFTFTQRGYNNELEDLGYRLGIIRRVPSGHYSTPRERRPRDDHWPIKEIVERHCDKLLAGTAYHRTPMFPYRGAGTTAMATICVYKKENEMGNSVSRGTPEQQDNWNNYPKASKEARRDAALLLIVDGNTTPFYKEAANFAQENNFETLTVKSYFSNVTKRDRTHKTSSQAAAPVRITSDPFELVMVQVGLIKQQIQKAEQEAAAASERAVNLRVRLKDLFTPEFING